MSDYIPKEILEEILIRVPSKSLIQFTCVSKSWYSLISSPSFIALYTEFNTKINNLQLIIRYYCRIYGKEKFVLCSDDDHRHNIHMPIDNYKHFDCPVKSSDDGSLVSLVGSCNGLVCLTDKNGFVHVWNPSLGLSTVLPGKRLYGMSSIYGIGFDSKTFDYKLVRIGFRYRLVAKVHVLALSKNSWKSIRHKIALPAYFIDRSPQVFVDGRIHWMGHYIIDDQRKRIVAFFDVVNEVFGEFALPDDVISGNDNVSIFECGQYLSLIQCDDLAVQTYDHCCIWVMKSSGMEESWTKLYTISPHTNFCRILGFRRFCQILLMTTSGEPILFDPQSDRVSQLKIYGAVDSFKSDAYMESLVLWKTFNQIMGKASSSKSKCRISTCIRRQNAFSGKRRKVIKRNLQLEE